MQKRQFTNLLNETERSQDCLTLVWSEGIPCWVLSCISFVYRDGQMTESKRIYRELKQDVVTCTLAPGLSISEQEMCERYRASRTPVREACRKLCEESLMQMIPFRAYSIPPFTTNKTPNLPQL